jgi:hypothetical protein
MMPGPHGISHKYDDGPYAMVHFVIGIIQLD